MFSETSLLCTGNNGKLLKTTNGGESWTPLASGTTDPISSIFFINNVTGWISAGNTVLRTINGGTSWTPVATLSNSGNLYFASLINGWRTSNSTYVSRTTNSGNNWQNYNLPVQCFSRQVRFVNNNTGYVFGASIDSAYVFKSVNGGLDWEIVIRLGGQSNTMQVIDQDNVLLCMVNKIHKTTNGGASWSFKPINSGLYTDMQFLNQETGYVCGNLGRVFATTNSGDNWVQLGSR